MNEGHRDFRIPAASIGDTDLVSVAKVNPQAALEIARLRDLMNRGEETREEFLTLCRLLFVVGSISASEYLLRRNLEFYEGRELYAQLFGSSKKDEFDFAIDAFKSQFNLELALIAETSFLVSKFQTEGGGYRSDDFAILARPCEIEFGYTERDFVEADIVSLSEDLMSQDADGFLLMRFHNGVWEIAD